MHVDGGPVFALDVVDRDAVAAGCVQSILDALTSEHTRSSRDPAVGIGVAGDDDYDQELGLAPQRVADHAGRVKRPQVLVFEVDQTARAPERLDVRAGNAAFSFGRERVPLAAHRIRSQHLHRVRTQPWWIERATVVDRVSQVR